MQVYVLVCRNIIKCKFSEEMQHLCFEQVQDHNAYNEKYWLQILKKVNQQDTKGFIQFCSHIILSSK